LHFLVRDGAPFGREDATKTLAGDGSAIAQDDKA